MIRLTSEKLHPSYLKNNLWLKCEGNAIHLMHILFLWTKYITDLGVAKILTTALTWSDR